MIRDGEAKFSPSPFQQGLSLRRPIASIIQYLIEKLVKICGRRNWYAAESASLFANAVD